MGVGVRKVWLLGARTAGAPLWASAAMTALSPPRSPESPIKWGCESWLRRPPRPATLTLPAKELATGSARSRSQNVEVTVSRRACQGRDAGTHFLGCWGGRGEAFGGSFDQWCKPKQTRKTQQDQIPGQQVFRVPASMLNDKVGPQAASIGPVPHPGNRNFLGCGSS